MGISKDRPGVIAISVISVVQNFKVGVNMS
jgi:hypothetical protein